MFIIWLTFGNETCCGATTWLLFFDVLYPKSHGIVMVCLMNSCVPYLSVFIVFSDVHTSSQSVNNFFPRDLEIQGYRDPRGGGINREFYRCCPC